MNSLAVLRMAGSPNPHKPARPVPLLKFEGDETPRLQSEGLKLIGGLEEPVCPIIVIGDGRAGKSYLGSMLYGEDVFPTDDSAEAVTEGIDTAAGSAVVAFEKAGLFDLAARTRMYGDRAQHIVVLDCEGGNNALAPVRTLVDIFGLLVTTEIIFVANGMASESALQALDTMLAAQSFIRMGTNAPGQRRRLTFVVNKTTLRYEDDTLEKMLSFDSACEDRANVREAIREAFIERQFFSIPLRTVPEFEEKVFAFRNAVLCNVRPLEMGGVLINGPKLCRILQEAIKALESAKEISVPSMHRYVIMETFLKPRADEVFNEANKAMIPPADYEVDLAERDPRSSAIERYDKMVSHILHRCIVDEVREQLVDRLNKVWEPIENLNNALGDQLSQLVSETHEVVEDTEKFYINGKGPLRNVQLTRRKIKRQIRHISTRKKGGESLYSGWRDTGETRFEMGEPSFEGLTSLPVVLGILWRNDPGLLGSLLGTGSSLRCMLLDGCFMWWGPSQAADDKAGGMINFLNTPCKVFLDPLTSSFRFEAVEDMEDDDDIEYLKKSVFQAIPTVHWQKAIGDFCICQRQKNLRPGALKQPNSESWVAALTEHLRFAEDASRELQRSVSECRPQLSDISTPGDWGLTTNAAPLAGG